MCCDVLTLLTGTGDRAISVAETEDFHGLVTFATIGSERTRAVVSIYWWAHFSIEVLARHSSLQKRLRKSAGVSARKGFATKHFIGNTDIFNRRGGFVDPGINTALTPSASTGTKTFTTIDTGEKVFSEGIRLRWNFDAREFISGHKNLHILSRLKGNGILLLKQHEQSV